MMIRRNFLALAAACLLLPGALPCASAVAPSPAPAAAAAAEDDPAAVWKSLRFQQGEITLGDGLAKLSVPAGFRFLGPEDAETVLVKLWGNPPDDEKPLGMLLPADVDPNQRGSWAVLITYEQGGYVKDNDADAINYDALLKTMQENARQANPQRVQQGYQPVEIVGWAAAPRYDKASSKLYWAKELQFGDQAGHTLNYDIRILGRRGVLVLSAIAGMDQLQRIQNAAPQVLAMVEFKQGNRYVDFDPKTDKTAAYGLAALVAGGVAAKAGLFKVLIGGLLAAKKFVILGVLALLGFVKKLFGGGSKDA